VLPVELVVRHRSLVVQVALDLRLAGTVVLQIFKGALLHP
jgi:hypothetical protein